MDELSLVKGSRVMILEKSGDGWWRGQYGNKVNVGKDGGGDNISTGMPARQMYSEHPQIVETYFHTGLRKYC